MRQFPLTRARATEIIREIGRDSTRWAVMIPYRRNADWRKVVNRRQIQLCLREGYVLEERAAMDDHGNWHFSIARVCSGLNITIEVALESQTTLPKLYVLRLYGEEL